jgi:hypothetical protein
VLDQRRKHLAALYSRYYARRESMRKEEFPHQMLSWELEIATVENEIAINRVSYDAQKPLLLT